VSERGVLCWAGFRTHILLPHDVVGAFRDDRPPFAGLEVQALRGEDLYVRHGKPVLSVRKAVGPTVTRVTIQARAEVWLQEPGLMLIIESDSGVWRGIGRQGVYTSEPLPLRQKDAHFSTVHFSRYPSSAKYTLGVEFREGNARRRFYSSGGFTRLLTEQQQRPVPWEGCQVFTEPYELSGVKTGYEQLKRWELAGKAPNIGQMYFLGWTGGPGCVVNSKGVTPGQKGAEPGERYDLLWQPRSWRRLLRGQSIEQTLRAKP
jgi:hypothetical protein